MEQLCLPMDLFHVEKEHGCCEERVESDGKKKKTDSMKAPNPSRLTSRYEIFRTNECFFHGIDYV